MLSVEVPPFVTETVRLTCSFSVNDLDDKDPVFAENPINNNSTTEGFVITSLLVENNIDPVTGKAADDHLEIELKNAADNELKGFEVYYTVKDNDGDTSNEATVSITVS